MSAPDHVIVLGAGPGGLACAHELAEFGIHSTVLERNSYVGGLCRTVEHNGYRFDLGGHRWFTRNQDLHNWFLRLMEGELVEVDRVSRIFHNNTFFHYPVSTSDVVRKSSMVDVARILTGFGVSQMGALVSDGAPRNMEDAFIAQFGRPLYEMFFKNYSEKVWGRPCNQLSADWVAQRSSGLSVKDIIKSALFPTRNNQAKFLDRFVYPRNGYMRVPERLAEVVSARSGTINTESGVSRIVYNGPQDFEVFFKRQGKQENVKGTHVVSTIPLGHLVNILEPAPEAEARRCADSLEFRDLVTVTVMLNIPRVTRDSWVYVQDRNVLFGRIHEPANWSRALIPDDGHTSLVMECFCSRGDDIWTMNDDDIIRRCVSDLVDRLGFVEQRNIVDGVVIRTPNAYPVYDLDYARKLEVINNAIRPYEGLSTVGRGGTFRYNNADHSIEMGLLCARRIAGVGVDHTAVNSEQEYHEIPEFRNRDRDRFVLKDERERGLT